MYKLSLIISFLFTIAFCKAQDISKFPLQTIAKPSAQHLIFYISGDGGMNSFSQSLTQGLADKNYAIVSLDSRKYFWEQKTPEKMAQDFNQIIVHYLKLWDIDEFSILGYSFGADAAIFLTPRLNKEPQQKVKSTVFLSPSTSTDFVIKLTDMIGFGSKEAKYKTLPELNKTSIPQYFIFGKDEESDFFKSIPDRKNITKALIPGSHKFNNDIKKVVSTVLLGLN
ncbi:AcvB/VirJ family lysyl-phosphatidylglycerol hydrolase [Pedobacter aquatilis]|uniref:AcvB/VirJ family lysyl-phosphatidylglycerol hydrolase n=1 Tax=Pedobacter aquatilis TaxID=351343 RepID=UPI002931CB74|nr:AcvB/VirJ family lysyl-phosphatidylglycerol hydrolase [Pedobacter aquatilis]